MSLIAEHAKQLDPFGIEIKIDLKQGLSPSAQTELIELYQRHKLLLFRDQDLTMDEQRQVVSYLGPLADPDPVYDIVAPNDGWLNSGSLVFHSDMAWVPDPPDGISLYAVDVKCEETYTAFIDACAAYRRIPRELANKIANLDVVAVTLGAADSDAYPSFDATGDFTLQRNLVRTHPITSEPILYIGRGAISRVIGMNETESRELLEELYSYIYDKKFVFKNYWRNGDLLIWDNLALQHARPSLTGVTHRTLRRVTIARYDLSTQLPASFLNPARIESSSYGNR